MQRRTSRNLSRAVVVAVILAVGATIWQSWTAGMPGMSGVVATQWGPLSPADRDLIVKVRLACLWEMSTGQQVQQQGTAPAVKEAGRKISAEHTDLDQKTRDIADKLGVPLPASPNAQQVAWMKEIASKTGSDYDRTAVQRLREAHGIVLPLLAEVRISTRNDLVRDFAADGTLYVTRHITYLESTGLVDYAALPEPQTLGLLDGLLSGSAYWTDLLVPGLVLIACMLAATLIGASLRGRRTGSAGKATLPPMVTTSAPRVATAAALIALPEAASTARTVASPPSGFPPVMSPGTPPNGIPDVPTPMHGIPKARVTDSGRHAVRR
jgi:predicted outer membrane protein